MADQKADSKLLIYSYEFEWVWANVCSCLFCYRDGVEDVEMVGEIGEKS